MNLENIMAVSGLPGLFKLITSRNNGILVSEYDTDKTRFLTMRKHLFTPLQTVAIYTEEDTIELKDVFKAMKAISLTESVPSGSESNTALFGFFAKVLPTYDRDRVKISDVKKILKWYHFLNERGVLDVSDEEE